MLLGEVLFFQHRDGEQILGRHTPTPPTCISQFQIWSNKASYGRFERQCNYEEFKMKEKQSCHTNGRLESELKINILKLQKNFRQESVCEPKMNASQNASHGMLTCMCLYNEFVEFKLCIHSKRRTVHRIQHFPKHIYHQQFMCANSGQLNVYY